MSDSCVFIVDDDQALCDALSSLLRSVDLRVKSFPSPQEFLRHPRPDVPSCLVLDVRLKGVSGLDFLTRLSELKDCIPVIVVTAHGDIAMSVRAMRAGAINFLTKPFRDQDILDSVMEALEQDRKRRMRDQNVIELRTRHSSLTPREQQVMAMATAGRMNKHIAGELALSEFTVKIHRRSVMKKMQAKSFAELVRMAQFLSMHQCE
jgi:FixJ family two-component response regulator